MLSKNGENDNFDIQPERPVSDVVVVESYFLGPQDLVVEGNGVVVSCKEFFLVGETQAGGSC